MDVVTATALALGALASDLCLDQEHHLERSGERGVWREFALGLSLMILFFVTWAAQGMAQWQTYTDTQREHGEPVEAGDFFSEFGQSTLENWQSEFLQLFSFVVLAALFIHKGSAESKDSDEKMEAALRRIEERLGTLPEDAPTGNEYWKLPDTSLKAADSSTNGALDSLSKDELYAIARDRDVPGRSEMTKRELEEKLRKE